MPGPVSFSDEKVASEFKVEFGEGRILLKSRSIEKGEEDELFRYLEKTFGKINEKWIPYNIAWENLINAHHMGIIMDTPIIIALRECDETLDLLILKLSKWTFEKFDDD